MCIRSRWPLGRDKSYSGVTTTSKSARTVENGWLLSLVECDFSMAEPNLNVPWLKNHHCRFDSGRIAIARIPGASRS